VAKFVDTWTRWLRVDATSSSGETEGGEVAKPLLGNTAGRGLAVLALIGATLMVLSKGSGPDKPAAGTLQAPAPTPNITPPGEPEQRLVGDLKAVLSRISGVGSVELYITFDTSAEQVVAEEITSQRTSTGGDKGGTMTVDLRETRRPVTLRDDAAKAERPLITVERKPRVRGVVVVAEGASSSGVRYEVTRAVQTALDVPAHRVGVFPMK
jgi:stage III sporulation protein AG